MLVREQEIKSKDISKKKKKKKEKTLWEVVYSSSHSNTLIR